MSFSATRNRFGAGRLSAWLGAPLLLAFALAPGCRNHLLLLGLLLGGPPSIEPDFEGTTRKSLTARNVTVAVVCFAPVEVKWSFDDVDREVATYVSHRLASKKIRVVDPDRVRAWLDQNPDWDKPEEIGRAFDATYVVYVDLHKFGLWVPNSTVLLQGQAEAVVSVYEMDKEGRGDRIYSREVISKYPLAVPRSAADTPPANFKRQYLFRLSEEIGRLFYPHFNGDDIGDAT
jgi:hypothetical protein